MSGKPRWAGVAGKGMCRWHTFLSGVLAAAKITPSIYRLYPQSSAGKVRRYFVAGVTQTDVSFGGDTGILACGFVAEPGNLSTDRNVCVTSAAMLTSLGVTLSSARVGHKPSEIGRGRPTLHFPTGKMAGFFCSVGRHRPKKRCSEYVGRGRRTPP